MLLAMLALCPYSYSDDAWHNGEQRGTHIHAGVRLVRRHGDDHRLLARRVAGEQLRDDAEEGALADTHGFQE